MGQPPERRIASSSCAAAASTSQAPATSLSRVLATSPSRVPVEESRVASTSCAEGEVAGAREVEAAAAHEVEATRHSSIGTREGEAAVAHEVEAMRCSGGQPPERRVASTSCATAASPSRVPIEECHVASTSCAAAASTSRAPAASPLRARGGGNAALFDRHSRRGGGGTREREAAVAHEVEAAVAHEVEAMRRSGGWPVNLRSHRPRCKFLCLQVTYSTKAGHVQKEDMDYDNSRLNSLFHVQTLRNFPVEKLAGEVVLVRLDSTVLLESLPSDSRSLSLNRIVATIKHLHNAGAEVLLISNWGQSADPMISSEFLADYLSSLLQLKVVPASGVSNFMEATAGELLYADIFLLDDLAKHREEVSNCLEFSKKLSSGATIFVNDAFSLSHKILASTVGVARFCHASIAGSALKRS
uniref:Phosphoglycerate kinase n=1 Tax=Ananas comosus var. bracteatus TaxID=296719 RepID=A0A6V7QLV7_ANACO|nr:unnamed protein product [Ananas comosus var. bracteatus]